MQGENRLSTCPADITLTELMHRLIQLGQALFRLGFCVTKKRYPIISILVAVVWAAFIYPPDRVPPARQAAKPEAPVPTATGMQTPAERKAQFSVHTAAPVSDMKIADVKPRY